MVDPSGHADDVAPNGFMTTRWKPCAKRIGSRSTPTRASRVAAPRARRTPPRNFLTEISHSQFLPRADPAWGRFRVNLAHAQAGARQEALDAITAAAAFRPSLELRNEAIAALCLGDAKPRRTWPLPLPATTSVALDPALESYFAEAAPGELVRRACADDRELGRLVVPGLSVVGIPVVSPDGRHLAARYADSQVRV